MPDYEQVYELVSVNSGKVMEVSGASLEDGAPVVQDTSQHSLNQQWYFKTVGEVNGQEAYQIVNTNSGKVLGVSGDSLDAGAPLQQQTSSAATSQQWYLNPFGNDENWQEIYQIVTVGSELVVDVNGGSQDNGATVQQWPSNGGKNQQWLLQAVAILNDVQLVVEKKFMQNYRTATPVNGGKEVVPVCTSSGQIQLFTIGSDNNVHTFYPDSTSETGYNEGVVTTGIQVTTLAAGLDSQGKVVVFVGAGVAFYYFTETTLDGSSWSAAQKVTAADWQVPGGVTKIARIVAQEIAGNLYVAILWATSDGQYPITYSIWQTDSPTFVLPPTDSAIFLNTQCVWLGNTADNVVCANFSFGALYLYDLSKKQMSFYGTAPKLDVVSVDTTLDASGTNQTFAVLEDENTYRLATGPEQDGIPQYSWQPLADWQDQDQPIPFQEVVVETDSNGAAQIFSVSAPMAVSDDDPTHYNVLYHWIVDAESSTGYATPPTPLHKSIGMQVGDVGNDHGSIELFAVESSNLVTHLFEEQEAGNWAVQTIESGSGDIEEYPSYATDVTVYDSLGALAVNVPVSITASEETRITANGATFFIDAQHAAHISTNSTGMISIAQETNALAIPSLQINIPSLMTTEPSIVVQPYADVQNQLATVTGDDLMNATVEDGSYLLADEYRNPDQTSNLAISINQCMDMVGTSALAATAHPMLSRRGPRRGVWYRSSGSASDLRRIASSQVGQHWRLSFEENRVIYQALTPQEAAALRAEKRATLPTSTGAFDWVSGIGDFVEGVADDIIDVLDTVIDEAEGAINAAITFIMDGVTYVFETVIEFVEQAFDMIEFIFAMVKVFFAMLYQWLAWLFAWSKFLYTKDAIAYTLNQFFLFLQGAAPAIQTLVDSGFDSLEQQIASIFDQAVNSLAGTSTVGGYEQNSEQADPQYDTAVSNNFVYNEFLNNAAKATGPSLAQALATDDPSSQFVQQLTDFVAMLEGTDAFAQALTYFQNLGRNPDQIFNLLLAGMLRLIQGLVEAGVSSIQALADSLLQLMQTIITAIQSTLNESWDIPFVSEFYKWLTGSTLTTLDLISLILAIPTTILYKLNYGDYPFSSSGDVNTFQGLFTYQTMLQASGLVQPSSLLTSDPSSIPLPTWARKFLAACYTMSAWGAGVFTASSDFFVPGTTPKVFTYTSYLFTASSLVCRFPWFFTEEELSCETKGGRFNWLWLGYCLGTALAGFALYVANKLDPNDFVIVMTVYGGVCLQLAIYASQIEDDAMRITWMIIPTLPLVSKILRHPLVSGPTGYNSVYVLMGIDGVCGAIAGILGGIELSS